VQDDQRHGRIFGVLFIITFVTSIPALALYQPVLNDPLGYITVDETALVMVSSDNQKSYRAPRPRTS
jgi:hypothetical protein